MSPDAKPPVALLAAEAPQRPFRTNYPEPFASRMAGRDKRPLGDLFGLSNFGVNITRLKPGGCSALRHAHTNQDEFVYVLSGRYDLWLDGKDFTATAGDLVRMPRGLPHGIFNKSGETATSLFWVAPTRSLKELFERIHNLPDPAEVVRIAAEHEVNFLPPPA